MAIEVIHMIIIPKEYSREIRRASIITMNNEKIEAIETICKILNVIHQIINKIRQDEGLR